jgi:hypothetical protein
MENVTARVFSFFLLAMAAWAQTAPAASPKFVWEGDVDEAAVLYIRGDRLTVEIPRGGRVEHQLYRFFHPAPDSRQQVRLKVVQGRGGVSLTQQPTLDNDYTIVVSIQDPQAGRERYSIELYWEASGDDFQQGAKRWQDRGWQRDGMGEPRGAMAKLTWRGHVDSEATVECRQSMCKAQVRQGMPVTGERVRFDKPLPQQQVLVSVAGDDANGNIRVVEQPVRSNGYAVRVQITNGCGAYKECVFTLTWREPIVAAGEPRQAGRRGMVWSGRVSGTIRVTVRGSSTLSEVRGEPIGKEQTVFDRALPKESGLSASIRTLQGRGRVAIVEFPSEKNGFSLVFEVRDPGPGADDYVVEVDW